MDEITSTLKPMTSSSTVLDRAVASGSLTRLQITALAVAAAMAAANRYYCQPLLADIARSFHLKPASVGIMPTLTQAGAALGLLLLVPLGDGFERRKLTVTIFAVTVCALATTAAAAGLWMLFGAAILIGLCSAASQVVVGIAALLSPASQRGRVIGLVTGGLLIGVLSSRPIAGLFGGIYGWRAMYVMAALATTIVTLAFPLILPASPPAQSMPYSKLMRSLAALIREQPKLRESSILAALAFAADNTFWTTLIFFIEKPPYHFGAKTAGLFGCAAFSGALIAPAIGRMTDRGWGGIADRVALSTGFFAFTWLFLLGHHVVGLVVGIILLDMSVQTNMVVNQTRIFSLVSEAGSRLNTVYMSTYFVGGALGTLVGANAWGHFGWPGVCAVGGTFFAIALLVQNSASEREEIRDAQT